jgi:hypothetical protein
MAKTLDKWWYNQIVIRITDERDVIEAKRMAVLDPFQLTDPSWLIRVLPQLPHVVENMRPTREQLFQRDKEKIMAVKFVAEQDAPQRLHGRGAISTSQEYSDTLAAIRAVKPGQAIVVTIESAELLKKEKPETIFAYAVRRYLAKNGIMSTAYASGKNEVTIRKAAAPPKSGGTRKK